MSDIEIVSVWRSKEDGELVYIESNDPSDLPYNINFSPLGDADLYANDTKGFLGQYEFVAKLQIALKECYETEYWIELFVKSELLNREIAKELYNQCGTIHRMLISSINTAKENVNDKK